MQIWSTKQRKKKKQQKEQKKKKETLTVCSFQRLEEMGVLRENVILERDFERKGEGEGEGERERERERETLN